MRRSYIGAAAALGMAALATASLAAGMGKAGLWEVTTKADMGGMMASITPEQRAKMKAMGIKIPENNTFSMTHCVTPQEAGQFKMPPMGRPGHEPPCRMANLKTTASSASADMVCDGKDMKGGGHFALAYNSPEHYAGKVTMEVDTHGHHMATTTTFEAKWLSADCKAH